MSRRARSLFGFILWLALGVGPCGPIPGGRLDGPQVDGEVDDWSFANGYERCQLETRPGDPHSVHASCFADGSRLYIGSVQGEVKRWTRFVEADPRVRIRIGGRVYPRRAVRVDDPAERVAAVRARARKYDGHDPGPDVAVPDTYWIYRLDSGDVP